MLLLLSLPNKKNCQAFIKQSRNSFLIISSLTARRGVRKPEMFSMGLGVLLLIFVPVVWGYKSGLVMDSCADMTPRHGQNPQTGSAPFTVTAEPNSNTNAVKG